MQWLQCMYLGDRKLFSLCTMENCSKQTSVGVHKSIGGWFWVDFRMVSLTFWRGPMRHKKPLTFNIISFEIRLSKDFLQELSLHKFWPEIFYASALQQMIHVQKNHLGGSTYKISGRNFWMTQNSFQIAELFLYNFKIRKELFHYH